MLASIRSRLGNVTGALVAMTLATALIAGGTLLMFVASKENVVSQRYGNAAVAIRTDPNATYEESYDDGLAVAPRLDPALADPVAQVPGVAQAVPDLRFYAQLIGPDGNPVAASGDGDSYGALWSSMVLTPFSILDGTAPAAPNEIAIDAGLAKRAGLAAGDRVWVVSSELPTAYTVTAIVSPELDDQSFIFFTAETAARLSGSGGKVDLIGVIAEPGVDAEALKKRIAETLNQPGLDYLTGDKIAKIDPTADYLLFQDAIALLGVMAGFSGFVSIFVIASTFSFSVQQRHREIGLLRAVGVTPRQVRLLIAAESLGLAAIGTLLAIPLSFLIAEGTARIMSRLELGPPNFGPEFSPWPFLIAFGAAIGISQLAAFGAGRRASKIRPIEALRESAVQKRLVSIPRFVIGIAATIGGIVMLGISSGLDQDGQVATSLGVASLFLVGAAMLGPLVSLPFSWVIGKILALWLKAPGDLARWNSRRLPNRVSSIASSLILAIGFGAMMFFLVGTIEKATIQQSNARTTADLIVAADSPGLPAGIVDQVAALPGVEAVSATVELPVSIRTVRQTDAGEVVGYQNIDAIGIDGPAADKTMNLDLRSGDLARLYGKTIAVSRPFADSKNWAIGSSVDLVLADGTTQQVTVIAIFRNALGFSDLVLPYDLALAHAEQPLVQQLFIRSADPDTVRSGLSELQTALPTMTTISKTEYAESVKQSLIDGAWAIYLIIGVSVLFAGLAAINTVSMATTDRVREFSLLRLVGGTPAQVRTMIFGESLIILAIGLITGLGIGAVAMIPVSNGLVGDLSAIGIPWIELLAMSAAAVVIAVGSHVLAARVALRINPMDHIGQRQ
jgi:putative ABC transport system permease protein